MVVFSGVDRGTIMRMRFLTMIDPSFEEKLYQEKEESQSFVGTSRHWKTWILKILEKYYQCDCLLVAEDILCPACLHVLYIHWSTSWLCLWKQLLSWCCVRWSFKTNQKLGRRAQFTSCVEMIKKDAVHSTCASWNVRRMYTCRCIKWHIPIGARACAHLYFVRGMAYPP